MRPKGVPLICSLLLGYEVILAAAGWGAGFGGDNLEGRPELYFYALVQTHDAVVDDGPISSERLEAIVKQRLRVVGIPVVERDTVSPYHPCLRLDVYLLEYAEGSFYYTSGIEFNERVRLERNVDSVTTAATWKATRYFGMRTTEVAVKEDVLDQLDQFVIDYLAANQSR